MIHGLEVKLVVVCQILCRQRLPFEHYNEHVIQANVSLEKLGKESKDNIVFWKRRGMCNSKSVILAKDGVHISQESQKKYLRSLRDCVIRVSRWFR